MDCLFIATKNYLFWSFTGAGVKDLGPSSNWKALSNARSGKKLYYIVWLWHFGNTFYNILGSRFECIDFYNYFLILKCSRFGVLRSDDTHSEIYDNVSEASDSREYSVGSVEYQVDLTPQPAVSFHTALLSK